MYWTIYVAGLARQAIRLYCVLWPFLEPACYAPKSTWRRDMVAWARGSCINLQHLKPIIHMTLILGTSAASSVFSIVYLYVYMCIYVHVCMCIYGCTRAYRFMYVCMHVYIHLYMYVCMYVYIYVRIPRAEVTSAVGGARGGPGSNTGGSSRERRSTRQPRWTLA